MTTGSRTTHIAYDSNGYPDYVLTPDGKRFDYSYDMMGRLLLEQRPDSSEVAYAYDKNGNVTAITNPKQTVNTFDYTASDKRNKWLTPSGSYLYSYDRERKLKLVQFPSGRQITNQYDHGLLASTTTPEGTVNYTYACSNQVSGITKGSEGIAYTYDGSLLKTDIRSGALNQSIAYTYNNDFRPISMTYAGAAQSFGYDADGLLTNAGSFTITRNAQNGLPEAVNDGIFANTRVFNTYGELNANVYAINGANRYGYNLTRDAAGRITQRVENVDAASIIMDYSYDSLGRLVEVKKNGIIAENYSYDANGNRLTANAVSFSYNAEDHIVSAGADSYQFNADGFLTRKTTTAGITQYEYSSRGEMLSVTKPDGAVIAYENDPLGRRIAKKINGNVTEKYLWQDMTRLLAVYDASNNLMMRFTYADSRLPVSMTSAGATSYLMYDQVGTLRAVADSSGSIVKKVDYDSFGNILSDTNPAMSVPFGFAGGLHDRDTDLVRFGYRDYVPEIARWTAKDPIDFAGGDLNLYGYVGMDPVNKFDPEGKNPYFLGLIIIDMISNIEFTYDDCGQRIVRIPPPTMWHNGVPLPYSFGLDIPINGSIFGYPTDLPRVTIDPNVIQGNGL